MEGIEWGWWGGLTLQGDVLGGLGVGVDVVVVLAEVVVVGMVVDVVLLVVDLVEMSDVVVVDSVDDVPPDVVSDEVVLDNPEEVVVNSVLDADEELVAPARYTVTSRV